MSSQPQPSGISTSIVNLEPVDPQTLFSLADECIHCVQEDHFRQIVRTHVKRVLPHQSVVAAAGRINLEQLEVISIIGVDHPEQGLDSIKRHSNIKDRLALRSWLESGKPLLIDLPEDDDLISQTERSEIEDFQLGRIAAHGVLDMAKRSGSYFSFCGIPRAFSRNEVANRVKMVVPFLHQALTAILQPANRATRNPFGLTRAEQEIIHLMTAGRTNSEIATIRSRSEATIRNQVTVLLRKMGVTNRTEAVRVHLLGG